MRAEATISDPESEGGSRQASKGVRLLVHDYGGYSFPLELSRELARRGNVVNHVFVNFLKTARTNFEDEAGGLPNLVIHALPMNPDYNRRKYIFHRRFLMNLGYGMRLMREIIRERPDLVLSANAPTEIQLPLCLLCSMRGIVFVNWVQDLFSLAVKRFLSNKSKLVSMTIGAIYAAADSWIVRRSAVSIVISDKFASEIDSWRLPRVTHATIPNWAPVEKLPAGPKNNPWGNRHGLASRFVFLYSGTLGLKHNPSLFLDLARHFESDEGVEIIVVAEGAGAEWLDAQAALQHRRNLRVLPYQPSEELPQVLASADVLMAVLEKNAGDFSVPSKVLTYFCAQRAILLAVPLENLASRTVIEHEMGLVSEPDDPDGFFENARRLYRDAGLREGMGARARRYAEENFKIERVADKFERTLGLHSRARDNGATGA